MRRLVTINLENADVAAFEAYEAAVLRLLVNHGGQLEMRVRAVDGSSETHLLCFISQASFEAYLADPARVALREVWDACGAVSSAIAVEMVLGD